MLPEIVVAGVMVVSGPVAAEAAELIEYATGLGIGMSDLPYPALEWYDAWHATNSIHGYV